MHARDIAAELDRLSQTPGIPERLARVLAAATSLTRAPRDKGDPLQLRRDIASVCAVMQDVYGADAIPMAERMVKKTGGQVFARIILTGLRRRARESARAKGL